VHTLELQSVACHITVRSSHSSCAMNTVLLLRLAMCRRETEGVVAGMMPGINETLEKVAKEKGLDFSEWQGKLKKEGRFHVEVY
jgi:hypothetical protein